MLLERVDILNLLLPLIMQTIRASSFDAELQSPAARTFSI